AAFRATQADAWDQLPLPSAPSESAVDSALRTLEATKLGHKSADQQIVALADAARIGDWEAVVEHGVHSKCDADPPLYYGRELPAGLRIALRLLVERAVAELLPVRRNQTLASYHVLAAYDAEYTALIRRR